MSALRAYFIGLVHYFLTFSVTLAASVAWHLSWEHAPSYAPIWAEDQVQTLNDENEPFSFAHNSPFPAILTSEKSLKIYI